MPVFKEASEHLRQKKLGAAAGSVWAALRPALQEQRELVLLKVDLRDPKNLRKEGATLRLLPFDRVALGRLFTLLQADPGHFARVRQRYLEGMSGFVAEVEGAVVGHVFFTPGSDDPRRVVHRDLAWLGLRPQRREVYTFDYWLHPDARGQGNRFVRAVQTEQAQLGYETSFGYVYATNTPALWLYRTTGWKEVRRLREDRYLQRLVAVNGQLWRMQAYGREPLWRA